jgi:hypothetical protein
MSGQLQVPATLSWGKTACTYRTHGWVDPSANLYTLEKRKNPIILAINAATVHQVSVL